MKNLEKIETLLTPKNDDLHLALTLLYGLRKEPMFAGIPELLSLIGWKSLLDLSHYCGGEVFKIPTESELLLALQAMQLYAAKLNGGDIRKSPNELKEAVKFIEDFMNDKFNIREISSSVKELVKSIEKQS